MDDRARVEQLLGRPPRGPFDVVVRDADGDPLVVRNSPFLEDGTPMPTLFYLVGTDLVKEVSRLEAAGGVRLAESAIPPDVIADVHLGYAAERDALVDPQHTGPRPSGGVGGTRVGVKCLHAHVAHELATGSDPVGRWALGRIRDHRESPTVPQGTIVIVPLDHTTRISIAGGESWMLPVGSIDLAEQVLESRDPPAPEDLTNAIGVARDHFEDVLIEAPSVLSASGLSASGSHAVMLGRVEVGSSTLPAGYRLTRPNAEEVFRTLVAESAAQRAENPGIDAAQASTILGTCCVILGIMRRLQIDDLQIIEPMSEETA